MATFVSSIESTRTSGGRNRSMFAEESNHALKPATTHHSVIEPAMLDELSFPSILALESRMSAFVIAEHYLFRYCG